MFETAIGNRTKQLGLEQEIAETGRVNTDVTTLLVGTAAGHSQVALLGGSGAIGSVGRGGSGDCWLCGLELLVGVVDEIFLGGHYYQIIERELKTRGEDRLGMKALMDARSRVVSE
jgi:hypothetical protein